jgi:hypothetical protein
VRVVHQTSGFAFRSCRISITTLLTMSTPASPIISHENDVGKMNSPPTRIVSDALAGRAQAPGIYRVCASADQV